MKSIKRGPGKVPQGVSLRAKVVSSVCMAALLFGTIAQSMPAFAQQGGDNSRGVHPIHTDLVAKQYTYDANGNHTGTTSAAGNEHKEYDVLGRLTRYEGPDGIEEYTYFGASAKDGQ